jgi:small subunit ribosomal protein S6
MVIIDPDLSEQDRTGLFDRIGERITAQSGYLVERDEWGTRKLAYEIKNKPRGYYTRLDYCGSGELVNELERNFRIDDRFLKYMTVLLEKEVDVEALKEAAAQKEAEEAAARAEKEAAEAEKKAAEAEKKATEEAAAAAETESPAETEAPADESGEATEAAQQAEPAAEAAPETEDEAKAETESPASSGDSEVKEGA